MKLSRMEKYFGARSTNMTDGSASVLNTMMLWNNPTLLMTSGVSIRGKMPIMSVCEHNLALME